MRKIIINLALAIQLALQDLKLLVLLADPAHLLLGDALEKDLRKGQGKPVTSTNPLTGGWLHASEINAKAVLMLSSFDIDQLASSLDVSSDLQEVWDASIQWIYQPPGVETR
jgi:anion-transporting  ArsA/GET3 family ATPase